MAPHSEEFDREQRLRKTPRLVVKSPETAKAPVSVANVGIATSDIKVLRPDSKVLRANRIVAPFLEDPDSEFFRMLRTQVLHRMKQRNARTLGICSSRPDEGKSLMAINLAISISSVEGKSVLLVELDLRRPSLLKTLGLSVEQGIDDVLAGDAEVGDCLVSPGYEGLVILPARKPRLRSSEFVSSAAMASLASGFRDQYPDHIIMYDMPPMLLGDECLALADHLDAHLFIVEEGKTQKNEIQRSLSLIDPGKILGTVLNKVSRRSHRQYGYY